MEKAAGDQDRLRQNLTLMTDDSWREVEDCECHVLPRTAVVLDAQVARLIETGVKGGGVPSTLLINTVCFIDFSLVGAMEQTLD
jgi:hypothetical protein